MPRIARFATLRRVAALLAAGALALRAVSSPAAEIPQIPLVPGVTVTFAVVKPAGDLEPTVVVRAITPDYYDALFSSEVEEGGARRMIEVPRRVRMQDQRAAHAIRSEYLEGDPHTFSGTVPFLSRSMIEDLRRGSTTITDQYSRSLFGMPMEGERRGTLTRVGFEKLPVLVNGRMTELRVIRARGELRDAMTNERETVDMVALDDLEYPLYLRWRESKSDSRVVRIEYPDPTAARARVEAALEARKPLDVYNVYFAFASATLRAQSKPALDDVAAVLKKHPDWKLRIEGHTDNVGGNASNLALSERRANAVRDALIRQYGIPPERLSAGGSGAGGAIATNDTPEGRARNRRVVLTRG